MGRQPRCYEPDAIYELEVRTIQGRFLLAPSEACCAVILGVLGRALWMFPNVRLFGFIFMSNHVHMIASASDGALRGGARSRLPRGAATAKNPSIISSHD